MVGSPHVLSLDELLRRVRDVCLDVGGVRLAIVFGSHATGKAGTQSDVDVGLLPSDPELPLAPELELARRLSLAVDAEVDLVRLDRDDPFLGFEVARTGRLAVEAAPGLFAAYRADAVSRWFDFEETIAPHRKAYLERLSRRVG